MIPIRLLGIAFAGAALTLPVPASAEELTGTYTLGRVTFQGNAQVPTAELRAALPILPGQKIDQAGFQQESDAVQAVYGRHNVGASMSTRLTALRRKADIAFTFVEQAPVAPVVTHVGVTADTVSVTGNTKVPTADILAASKIRPGQIVTNPEISAAQTAIVALYKKANVGVAVNTDWTNLSPQHVAMVFKITEKDDS